MEIIIGLIVLYLIYVFFLKGGSNKKSSSLKVSDFIKEETYDVEEAANVVYNFAHRKGLNKKKMQGTAENFMDCIDAILKQYKKERKESQNESPKIANWYEKQIEKLQTNVKPELRKYLNELKSLDNDTCMNISEYDIHDVKDPPDSYY